MKRMFWAALFALLAAGTATAQQPSCASCAPSIPPPMPYHAYGWYPGQGPFGCNGFCLKLFGTWLQDGPLVNYGPYEGYYPFEPYGPWTSDLRYTGPRTRPGHLAGFGAGAGGCADGSCGWNGLFHKKACGDYALSTYRNVFHRVKPKCGGCGY